ncbi:MAG: hypothetical protein JWM98_344 [Thermoleophilia bacterium]|nr:hypothetical protein [Thermoleophilia bacterium]
MTAALTSSPAALPTAAAKPNPLAGLTARVKRINPEELFAVAQQVAANDAATLAQMQGTQGQAQGAAAPTGQGQAAAAQSSLAAAEAAQTQALAQLQAETQAQAAAAQQQQQAAAAQAQTQAQAPTAATTTRTDGAVAIPSSSVAPRTKQDYWTKHIAQFAGKYLPDGPSMRPNCGPASTTMALRMVGLDVPGFSGQNSEAVLDKARVLATGRNDTSVGTTDSELENLITASGGKWSESTNFGQVTDWVKQGIPVVLSGNPSKGWNSRYRADQVYPFDGGHWVTVSGFDQATGHYIVNDPLSQIGPIYVSEAELRSYNQAHGQLGIAVFR